MENNERKRKASGQPREQRQGKVNALKRISKLEDSWESDSEIDEDDRICTPSGSCLPNTEDIRDFFEKKVTATTVRSEKAHVKSAQIKLNSQKSRNLRRSVNRGNRVKNCKGVKGTSKQTTIKQAVLTKHVSEHDKVSKQLTSSSSGDESEGFATPTAGDPSIDEEINFLHVLASLIKDNSVEQNTTMNQANQNEQMVEGATIVANQESGEMATNMEYPSPTAVEVNSSQK